MVRASSWAVAKDLRWSSMAGRWESEMIGAVIVYEFCMRDHFGP